MAMIKHIRYIPMYQRLVTQCTNLNMNKMQITNTAWRRDKNISLTNILKHLIYNMLVHRYMTACHIFLFIAFFYSVL